MKKPPSKPLRSLLKSSLRREKDNRRRPFLPAGAINSICNPVTVHEELLRYYVEPQATNFAEYVCSSGKPAREIFSILVLTDKVSCIHKFWNAGIFDDDLALGSNDENTELWTRHSTNNEPIAFANNPEDSDMIEMFYEKQWSVHVPVFNFGSSDNQGPVHCQFDEGTIMPWIFLGKKNETGGYGTVEKLKIHSDHYHSTRHNTFALKILRSDIEDPGTYFQREMAAFKKLRRGPHLVELVATIEIAECQFMFIFPWAEGGTLEDLITQPHSNRSGPLSLLSQGFVRWVLDQCRGLVEALETIHFTRIGSIVHDGRHVEEDYGIHLDIKPSNILYFSQETDTSQFGTLKLADCGLMEFHSLASRSRKSVTGCSAGPRTYRSPEYDFNRTMSKKVDIWAIGCVFSEFLTWAILPHGSVDEYRLTRTQEPSLTSAKEENKKNYESSFFQHYLQYEVTDGAVVSVPELATQTDQLCLHVRARKTNSDTWRLDSDKLRTVEIPRLKPCVSLLVAKLISQVQYETDPGCVMKFLAFIEKK